MSENLSSDERVLAILKTVALGNLCAGEMDFSCPYCSEQPMADGEFEGEGVYRSPHEPQCPVRLARGLLMEMRMPLGYYRVTLQRRLSPKDPWYPLTFYEVGYSAQETRERVGQVGEMRDVWVLFLHEIGA